MCTFSMTECTGSCMIWTISRGHLSRGEKVMWPDELIFTLPDNFSNFYSDKAATKSEGRNDQYIEYTIYTMDICTYLFQIFVLRRQIQRDKPSMPRIFKHLIPLILNASNSCRSYTKIK